MTDQGAAAGIFLACLTVPLLVFMVWCSVSTERERQRNERRWDQAESARRRQAILDGMPFIPNHNPYRRPL